jgi:hypothetical protein
LLQQKAIAYFDSSKSTVNRSVSKDAIFIMTALAVFRSINAGISFIGNATYNIMYARSRYSIHRRGDQWKLLIYCRENDFPKKVIHYYCTTIIWRAGTRRNLSINSTCALPSRRPDILHNYIYTYINIYYKYVET